METNPNQLTAKDSINIPEKKKPREEDSPPSYCYVEPEFYNEWWQETQQETPLDRKILAVWKVADELEKQNEKTIKWFNSLKTQMVIFWHHSCVRCSYF
jgi:hypothetical protein